MRAGRWAKRTQSATAEVYTEGHLLGPGVPRGGLPQDGPQCEGSCQAARQSISGVAAGAACAADRAQGGLTRQGTGFFL